MSFNWDGIRTAKDQFDLLAKRMEKLKEEINKSMEEESEMTYKHLLKGNSFTVKIDWQPCDPDFIKWALENARYEGEDDYNYNLPRKSLSGKLKRSLR